MPAAPMSCTAWLNVVHVKLAGAWLGPGGNQVICRFLVWLRCPERTEMHVVEAGYVLEDRVCGACRRLLDSHWAV